MSLSNRIYDIMKWCVMVLFPALSTCYCGLAAVFNWPYADEVAKATVIVCTFLGALLGISTAEYNKDKLD